MSAEEIIPQSPPCAKMRIERVWKNPVVIVAALVKQAKKILVSALRNEILRLSPQNDSQWTLWRRTEPSFSTLSHSSPCSRPGAVL